MASCRRRKGAVDLTFAEGDFRATLERAQDENLQRNQALTDILYETGARFGLTAFEISLVWLFSRGEDILPIPGMRRMSSLHSNVKAEAASVPSEVLDELTAIFAQENVSGGRYTVEKGVTENQQAAFS